MGGCVLFRRRCVCLLLGCFYLLVTLATDGPARPSPVEEEVCIRILNSDQQELEVSYHGRHTTEASALEELTYESSKWCHLSVTWLYAYAR